MLNYELTDSSHDARKRAEAGSAGARHPQGGEEGEPGGGAHRSRGNGSAAPADGMRRGARPAPPRHALRAGPALRNGLLSALLLPLLLGCGTTPPLPEGEMPPDFYFQYTVERTGSTAEAPIPFRVQVSVSYGGAVHYEVSHQHPFPVRNTGQASVDERRMSAFYETVRQADLFSMPERQEGSETALGTQKFFVVGRNRVCEVVTKDLQVAALETLRAAALDLAGSGLLDLPKTDRKIVVLDARTFVFHRSESPEVQKIPAESRREFPDPWSALNAGGIPAPDFGPLKDWD